MEFVLIIKVPIAAITMLMYLILQSLWVIEKKVRSKLGLKNEHADY